MAKKNDAKPAELNADTQELIANLSADGGDWEPIQGQKNLKLEAGDTIEGYISQLPYDAGKSAAFDIVPVGEEASVTYWCPTVLRNRLKPIRVGDHVAIRCLGRVLHTQNGAAYDYAVARKK